jgi:hypothetical protein
MEVDMTARERFVQGFAPPVFAGDELATRRASLLNIVLIATGAFMLLAVAGNLLGGRTP